MKFLQTKIPDVVVVEPTLHADSRGWFMESFNEQRFHEGLKALGLPVPRPFVQDNHSLSHAGVLRGLHYQLPPHAQGKLVRVVSGRAFDVAVDIRRSSPTFGQWVGVELDALHHRQVWIPEGFAHGFLALEDGTQTLYKVTSDHAPSCERSVSWNDSQLGIIWPENLVSSISLSRKDAQACSFDA